MNSIVVFGSALRVQRPGDIDIACSEKLSQSDRKLIASWAEQKGLETNLPIDEHKIVYGNAVALPCLCGASKRDALILQGSPKIEWMDYWSIPAILRVWGHTPNKACEAWKYLRTRQSSLFNCMVDIGDVKASTSDEWINYITGLKALRSGVAKAPGWNKIIERIPEGKFLDALVKRGANTTGINWARRGSSGGQARLLLREEGICTQYGSDCIAYDYATANFVNK